MKNRLFNAVCLLAAGLGIGWGSFELVAPTPVAASTAHGNDVFSMVTVPVNPVGDTEAVFVLNHLTGILRGAVLNNQTGQFGHNYVRNVALDFQLNPQTPETKYAIVSAPADLQAGGGPPPANGVIYVGELSSGAVIAYGFQQPQGRGINRPLEITRINFFKFRDTP